MSHTGILNQELIRQGLVWVKSQSEELTEFFNSELSKAFPTIPPEQRREIAHMQTQALIHRMEGINFNTGQLKNLFFDYLSAGVPLQRLISVAEFLQERFAFKVRQELAAKPQVCEALINKAGYVTQLLKATMASALISYEGQKQAPS